MLRPLRILLHTIFFLSGISTVLIGQILPMLANRFSLNDLESGYFFPAQFAGSLTGTFLTNWFGKRGELVRASIFGSLLMAAGVLMLNADSFPVVLAGFLINGLGIGLTLPAINILILELNPMNSAAALTFLNFFWGAGAIISKPFVDYTSRGTSLFLTTLLLAIPLAVGAAIVGLQPKGIELKAGTSSDMDEADHVAIWSTPIAWAIAFFNFVHVGFESGMGGWLTTYATRLEGGPILQFLPPTVLYFLFFVIGRGIAPFFFRFLNENRALFLSLLVMLAGLGVTLFAQNVLILSIGASIAGFGTSSVFPTNISRFSKIFGAKAMRRATPLFICGTLGATVITWLIGFLSNQAGSLRAGMFILVISVAILLILQIGLSLRQA